MKITSKFFLLALLVCFISCKDAQVEKDIVLYSNVWDEIINNGNLDFINESNFDTNITLVSNPENIIGIENFKSYYSNFTTGFSEVEFTIKNIFGQKGNLVKHWDFKGKHTGNFFGIPATGKTVHLNGVTLVKMKNGKIAQEQDFMDNLEFMGQLGIDPFLTPDNTKIIKNLYDAFAKGDIDTVKSAMDENLVWNEAENFPYADGNPYKGFEAVLNGVFGRIMEEWEYFHTTNLEFHEMTNNKILVTGRYEAKYKKNNTTMNLQMAHLWTFKDSKIISFQQYTDTKGISEVISK